MQELLRHQFGSYLAQSENVVNDLFDLLQKDVKLFVNRIESMKQALQSVPGDLELDDVARVFEVRRDVVVGWIAEGKVEARVESGRYILPARQFAHELWRQKEWRAAVEWIQSRGKRR